MGKWNMQGERMTAGGAPGSPVGGWCHAFAPQGRDTSIESSDSAAGAAEALLLAEPKSEWKSKKCCCVKAFDLTSLPRYEK